MTARRRNPRAKPSPRTCTTIRKRYTVRNVYPYVIFNTSEYRGRSAPRLGKDAELWTEDFAHRARARVLGICWRCQARERRRCDTRCNVTSSHLQRYRVPAHTCGSQRLSSSVPTIHPQRPPRYRAHAAACIARGQLAFCPKFETVHFCETACLRKLSYMIRWVTMSSCNYLVISRALL